MNTEDDFWSAILAEPLNRHCVMVFADWLQDRDDPRAEGMRAIGRYGIVPCESKKQKDTVLWNRDYFRSGYFFPPVLKPENHLYDIEYNYCARAMIPDVWFTRLNPAYPDLKYFKSRRDAYDALAIGFPGDEMLRAGA